MESNGIIWSPRRPSLRQSDRVRGSRIDANGASGLWGWVEALGSSLRQSIWEGLSILATDKESMTYDDNLFAWPFVDKVLKETIQEEGILDNVGPAGLSQDLDHHVPLKEDAPWHSP